MIFKVWNFQIGQQSKCLKIIKISPWPKRLFKRARASTSFKIFRFSKFLVFQNSQFFKILSFLKFLVFQAFNLFDLFNLCLRFEMFQTFFANQAVRKNIKTQNKKVFSELLMDLQQKKKDNNNLSKKKIAPTTTVFFSSTNFSNI